MSDDEPLPFDRPLEGYGKTADGPDMQGASDNLKKLMSQASRKATPWRPEAGDVIGGTVIDIGEAESDFGDPAPLLTIEAPDQTLWQVFGWHTVLRRELNRRIERGVISIGSEIAVVYMGPDPAGSKSGRNPTELYQVYASAPDNAPHASEPF
jgi:hypothetical protein